MDLNKEMDQLEANMESLRARYRMHFAGSQAEPLQYRWQLEGFIRRLQGETFTNPAQANRFRAILQKYGNYRALWNRLRREKMRARGALDRGGLEEDLAKELDGTAPDEARRSGAADASGVGAERSPQAVQEIAEAAKEASPPEEFRPLFDEYVEARRRTGEYVDGLSFEAFQKHMRAQQEALRSRYPGKEYVFGVAVTNGKAVLSAELKKS